MSEAVLTHTQGDADRPQALAGLWARLDDAIWPDHGVPIVIQVGVAWRSALVLETARSLGEWLAAHRPGSRIEIVDASGTPAKWPGFEPAGWTVGATVPVSGLGATRSVTVPAAWFEPFFLATVTGAGPAADTRVSGPLEAQAEVLFALNPSLPRGALRAEAHRLGRSDLAVVCGRSGTPLRDWWLASASDLAAEAALAAACGLDPARLPTLARVARHEPLPLFELTAGPAPGFRAAPRWRTALASLGERWTGARATLANDVPAVRRNVKRIPGLVRRYAAMLGLARE